jgi:hypothetical protein
MGSVGGHFPGGNERRPFIRGERYNSEKLGLRQMLLPNLYFSDSICDSVSSDQA